MNLSNKISSLLKDAHNLKEITDPFPTVEFGLYRFYIALVMDIFNIKNIEDVIELLDEGKFDEEKIDSYFGMYGNRFDLFDEEHPFLQINDIPEKDQVIVPATYLVPGTPSGINAIFFNKTEDNYRITEEEAFKLLTVLPAFTTLGGFGKFASINGAPPWYVLIKGNNLFETIVYNCYALNQEGLGVIGDTPPSWRNDNSPDLSGPTTKTSLLEGLTWRPRCVKLFKDEAGISSLSHEKADITIKDIYFTRGCKCAPTLKWIDPNVAYTIKDKMLPVRPQENKPIWRNTGAFTFLKRNISPTKNNIVYARPAVIDQFQYLVDNDYIDQNTELIINVYGLRTDKAKIFEWQKDTLSVPIKVIINDEIAITAIESLDLALNCSIALRKSVKQLVSNKETLVTMTLQEFWNQLKPKYSELLHTLSKGNDTSEWVKEVNRITFETLPKFACLTEKAADVAKLVQVEIDLTKKIKFILNS